MVNSYVDLEFVGFEPARNERNAINGIIEKLHTLAPSDSVTRVIVENGLGVVKATCRIASAAGSFVATAVEVDPIDAIHEVYNSIHTKLESWKKNRFLLD